MRLDISPQKQVLSYCHKKRPVSLLTVLLFLLILIAGAVAFGIKFLNINLSNIKNSSVYDSFAIQCEYEYDIFHSINVTFINITPQTRSATYDVAIYADNQQLCNEAVVIDDLFAGKQTVESVYFFPDKEYSEYEIYISPYGKGEYKLLTKLKVE